MGQIAVLDDNMINMIAAGEVIERPASVVKELMENSIDAGAGSINVTIEDGGKKLIAVSDNGKGIEQEDLGRAFEPHATSKIRTSDDLSSISTMGFRGEALASIASVAAVKTVSRTAGSQEGYSIEIDCGVKSETKPYSADIGTRIEVRDLFYKMPARCKFLRTANTEFSHISEQFIRIALANNQLNLTLTHNNKQIYNLSQGQSLRERITELFSRDIAESLIETQINEKGIEIFAMLSRPDTSRTNSKLQYTFLNGRFIRDKFISHALREAYRTFIEGDRYGIVFLFIKMPLEDYDVNVHPTKIEVRFYNANLIHSQVLAALREKLLGTDFNTAGKIPIQHTSSGDDNLSVTGSERSQNIRQAMDDFFKKHRPVSSQQNFSFKSLGQSTKTQTERYSKPTYEQFQPAVTESQYFQIHDSYIIIQTQDGFEVVDQHALHERILYNQISTRVKAGTLQSQKLLLPESFQVTVAQEQAWQENNDTFEKLGLELVSFGPKTLAVQSFPTLLRKANAVEFVSDLLDMIVDNGAQADADSMLDDIINMAACKGAIKAGQKLNDSEIGQLLADRQNSEMAGRCAHGRPTAIKFSLSDLEKQFKRT